VRSRPRIGGAAAIVLRWGAVGRSGLVNRTSRDGRLRFGLAVPLLVVVILAVDLEPKGS
jgi:hypothetical protein